MNTYQFGTVLGYYSAAELKDLVAAKDVAMRNLARRFGEVSDKIDLDTFLPAYNALTSRYAQARSQAMNTIDDAENAWRPMNMVVADSEYKNLLGSLNPRWQEYTWSPGDGSIDDLYDRLDKAGAIGSYDESTPQPGQGTDVDFNVFTTTNEATHAIESAGKTAVDLFDTKHLALYGIVGGALLLFVLPKLTALSMGPLAFR
jgi:hypothetical protein